MEKLDTMFEKWPNWLRWILFLPIAFLSAFLLRLIGLITATVMGDILYGLIPEILFAIAEVSGFLIGIYTVVPSKKHIFLIIFASLIICLYGGVIFINISKGNILVYNNLINLAGIITAITFMCSLCKESDAFESN